MPFAIDPTSKPKRQVRAAARERIDIAIDALTRLEHDEHADVEAIVHGVRKRCKEIRALARLVRPAIGSDFDRCNRLVRDAAKELSPIRDAHALLGTLDDLLSASDDAGDIDLETVRHRQAERAAAATDSLQPGDPRIRHAAELLVSARQGVKHWDIEAGTEWLADGLRASYRRARRAFRAAADAPTDDTVHEWRKAVKTLWYQMRLVEIAAPSMLTPFVARLDDLADALGDDHDLAVLATQLDTDPEAYGGSDYAATAADRVRLQQDELRQRALRLGTTLFAETTGAFVARMTTYWQAAIDDGPELATAGIAALVADEQHRAPSSAPGVTDDHLERERKFIVDTVPDLPDTGIELRQGYLAIDGSVSVRVRDAGPAGCTLTIKAGRGSVRTELEWPITDEQFEVAWERTEQRRVHKTRHRIDLPQAGHEHVAVVDVFHGVLGGVVVAEVDFDSDESMASFIPPAWFGREVTDDPAYTNASLAVNGSPPR